MYLSRTSRTSCNGCSTRCGGDTNATTPARPNPAGVPGCYDPGQSLRGWVLGIARKRAIDHLRKRRDVVVPLDSMREITGDDGREIADRLVWADEVRGALDLLPELQREVLELAYFSGYTQVEISTSLGIPLGTVKTRTARGLQRLSGLLENTRGQR